jgi:hypothetical protein
MNETTTRTRTTLGVPPSRRTPTPTTAAPAPVPAEKAEPPSHVRLLAMLDALISPHPAPGIFEHTRRTGEFLPFAIGTRDVLCERICADAETMRAVYSLFGHWCWQPGYIAALGADGAVRFTLDAEPAEPVSAEHALVAAVQLHGINERLARERAKQRAKK